MEDLKFEFITGIEGCSGDDISPFFETIELHSLKSLVYEVEGFPTESDGEDNERICNFNSTDKFETVWEDVFQFLLTGMFPASKISKKSKENFSRRCAYGIPWERVPQLDQQHCSSHQAVEEKHTVRTLPYTPIN